MWERFSEWVVMVLYIVVGLVGGGGAAPDIELETLRSEHRVEYVIDGDTVVLDTGERVRFLGIDTPEREECYFAEATAFTTEQLTGRTVTLERDETDKDKYDRLLRYVYITNEAGEAELFNTTLVAQGYAELLSIPPDRRYRAELQAAEVTAREAQLGRWGVCAE